MMRKEEFLKGKKGGVSEHHKEYLGMDVPDGFFANSKQSILDLVKEEGTRPYRTERSGEEKTTPVFYLRRSFQVAASITLLVVLTVWFQFSKPDIDNAFEIASDDVLIESLFVEDIDMNRFVNDIVVSEIVVEAEISEQNLENIFMNSLFVEDSLIDGYTKESLLDHIIL